MKKNGLHLIERLKKATRTIKCLRCLLKNQNANFIYSKRTALKYLQSMVNDQGKNNVSYHF